MIKIARYRKIKFSVWALFNYNLFRDFAVNLHRQIGGNQAITDIYWGMIERKVNTGFEHIGWNTVHLTIHFGMIESGCFITHLTFFLLRYRAHLIGNPYLIYTIRVTLQQLNFETVQNGTQRLLKKQIWRTIGNTFVGPQRESHNIPEVRKGNSSSPQVLHMLQLVLLLTK